MANVEIRPTMQESFSNPDYSAETSSERRTQRRKDRKTVLTTAEQLIASYGRTVGGDGWTGYERVTRPITTEINGRKWKAQVRIKTDLTWTGDYPNRSDDKTSIELVSPRTKEVISWFSISQAAWRNPDKGTYDPFDTSAKNQRGKRATDLDYSSAAAAVGFIAEQLAVQYPQLNRAA